MWRSMPARLVVLILVGSSLPVACGAPSPAPPDSQVRSAANAKAGPIVERYGYEIVQSHPHDPAAFTQGLTIADGQLYEGTGLHGQSSLRRVDLAPGAALQRVALDEPYFGEGVAVVGDRIIQLT